jgi:hypothetical protein
MLLIYIINKFVFFNGRNGNFLVANRSETASRETLTRAEILFNLNKLKFFFEIEKSAKAGETFGDFIRR